MIKRHSVMYNKSSMNNNNELDEIVIKLDSDTFEKLLFYRDEGNMNIVVSLYARDNDEKLVIRFKKVPVEEKVQNSIYIDKKTELMSFVHYEELLQNYFENSEHFTVVPKIVFLDVDVHALNGFLMRDRPANRRRKIIGNNYGLLYRDVAFLPKEILHSSDTCVKSSPTICLEIKAKQGYVNDDDSDTPFGVRKCRYCYFQYLKLKKRKIKSISHYCPIDLFSNNAERVNSAIKSLLSNPQNNLKIFRDGRMVYNEYLLDKDSLHEIFSSLFPETLSSKRQELLFVNLIRKILVKDFTFCDNMVDIGMIRDDSDNVHTRNCISAESDAPIPKNCILNSVFKAQLLVKNNFSKMDFLDRSNEPLSCHEGTEPILQNYKVGSTALDCSIMITLKRIMSDNENIPISESLVNKNHLVTITEDENIQNFVVNPTIVDLDMKKDALAHYRKYKKQYRESKIAYVEFMENNQR